MSKNIEPRLYIIMREDLYDMNPGKGMAQAAHAQAEFSEFIHLLKDRSEDPDIETSQLINRTLDSYDRWISEGEPYSARSFGTTIVLSATKPNIDLIIKEAQKYQFGQGIVVDPTYPFKNFYGKVYVAREETCAWVFVPTVWTRTDEHNFYNLIKEVASLHH